MNDLFSVFSTSSKEEWISILEKELKGASIDTLMKTNRVEEIAYPSFVHASDQKLHHSDPGSFPFTRGYNQSGNDWQIANTFLIGDLKATNVEICKALMTGTSHLILQAQTENEIDFSTLLKTVSLPHIETTFCAKSIKQVESFIQYANQAQVSISLENQEQLVQQLCSFVAPNTKVFHVDASSVQQAGANTWQEIAFALAQGHEYLVLQLEAGIAAEQAVNSIHFTFGIGNKFYFELSKFRAFRTCWANIVNAYISNATLSTQLTAKSSFMHTSLKDPYTNLLRQTTEAMSAVLGGVSSLNVMPYDWYSTGSNLDFSRRMATNISLLLKEESYLNVVADPAGGSYALELLHEQIAERAWELFKSLEASGGIQHEKAIAMLKKQITDTANIRLEEVRDKREKLIGITIFPNPIPNDNQWKAIPACWQDLKPLIIEQEL
jgi:methylmalonyl-CoA mutase